MSARTHYRWQLGSRTLLLGQRTHILGIVNVTPDSFSDGGAHASPQAAVDHALRLLDEGADVLDLGGESTRPGSGAATSQAIAAHEEQGRVLPVLEGILHARPDSIVSIDTYRASTALCAVQAGAQIVNDVSGLQWDHGMAGTLAALRCGVILMHTRGLPSTWQHLAPLAEQEVLPLVRDGLQASLRSATDAGIARERIVLDLGFGFGKRGAENWTLLRQLSGLTDLGLPVLAGLSRKGFLAPELAAAQRDDATHAAGAQAIAGGAHLLRVHDVAGARRSADLADDALDRDPRNPGVQLS